MDAARLVAEAERVMRGHPQPEDVIAEAWQAYELTEAVGLLLAAADGTAGDGAGRDAARRRDGASPAGQWGAAAGPGGVGGGTGRETPPRPVIAAGPGLLRSARLTGVRDPAGTVHALRLLLGEIGLALVDITCAAEDETAYWACVEALDAVDEAKERARALARPTPG
jgi:Family of unknown function (DUF6099)